MNNRLPIFCIALALVLMTAYSSVFVVNQRQQAIVVRFGQIKDVKTEPGLYFKLPFAFMDADRVQYVEKQALRFDLDNIRVQVSGGKFYEVDAFVVYKIADARRFRETVSGDRRIGRIAAAHPPRCVAAPGLRSARLQIRAFRRAGSMMREVRADLKTDAESLGLEHRGCPHPPHRPDAGSLAADLRPHEGRASCRSGADPSSR